MNNILNDILGNTVFARATRDLDAALRLGAAIVYQTTEVVKNWDKVEAFNFVNPFTLGVSNTIAYANTAPLVTGKRYTGGLPIAADDFMRRPLNGRRVSTVRPEAHPNHWMMTMADGTWTFIEVHEVKGRTVMTVTNAPPDAAPHVLWEHEIAPIEGPMSLDVLGSILGCWMPAPEAAYVR